MHAVQLVNETAELQEHEFLAGNIVMRTSGFSTARDAAAAQEELMNHMYNVGGWVYLMFSGTK